MGWPASGGPAGVVDVVGGAELDVVGVVVVVVVDVVVVVVGGCVVWGAVEPQAVSIPATSIEAMAFMVFLTRG